MELSIISGGIMDVGHFYFIDDSYFLTFPDPYLMSNKDTVSGIPHDRPCFYSFIDPSTNLFWMIPISSQIAKYKKVHAQKIARWGKCLTIHFGDVLGYTKAFLIQNMCPVSNKYIKGEYIDHAAGIPVRINSPLEQKIIQDAKQVLFLTRQGKKLIFPDVLIIEKELLK
jgi:hypothetical protein